MVRKDKSEKGKIILLKLVGSFILSLFILYCLPVLADENPFKLIDQHIQLNKNKSGIFVLDRGEEALIARAWLANNAQQSIDVQYFIWSTDNIGILASEALLSAAERGVKVRVIVDDLLIDAPDESLIALALHPNVQIKIYNPKHSVGVLLFQRIKHLFTNFRSVNQRMHDKTFIVDGKVAITGGRNMADEYFDYNHTYNFRDRDALVIGKVVKDMDLSFDRFWESELTETVEQRFKETDLLEKNSKHETVKRIYKELHEYARSPENFKPEVRHAISHVSEKFPVLFKSITWTDARFISDMPGKNAETRSLGGGGLSTGELAALFNQAKKTVVIQSPYLVLSQEAKELFLAARKRGVEIIISTNSLASTDNLQAFSGYRSQRDEIMDMGIEIYEYQPYPIIQEELLERYPFIKDNRPIFAIHAKTMIIDSKTVYIGTYNLDPRSQNLNTEVGIIATNENLAVAVEKMIMHDIKAGNSWPAKVKPDQYATLVKRLKVFFWQLLPLQPIL